MQRPKQWNISPAHPAAPELASRLKTSRLIAQILLNRGMFEQADCLAFLRPTLNQLHQPDLLEGLPRAAERIAAAIRSREKIVIYGDYDVDGITATAILWHAIRTLGGSCEYFVPHRIDDGYGLNRESIEQLIGDGARLIVSVDCGITAVECARVAKDRGIDLIITDHHEWRTISEHEENGPRPHLPDCYATVHPRLPSDRAAYANPALCGAGVAYKLAWGIGVAMSGSRRVSDEFREFLIDATALAALGTIADVVPLVGENRTLAHFGLGGLKRSKMVGLRALIESAGLTGQKLTSFDIGFRLGPRLNAAGRMDHAKLAVEMLTSADMARATEIATGLEKQNRERQGIEKAILAQAIEQVTELKLDCDSQCAIVVGHEQWHPGVIGIVASRIVERYHRPAIVIALQNGHGQGSGRSIADFNLAEALCACSEHLESHGGHAMAAGLKLNTANFEAFRRRFCEHAASILCSEQLVAKLQVDAEAEFPELTEAFVADMHRLGPFGPKNRRPVLCCREVEIAGPPRRVGRTGDHLQFYVRQGKSGFKCIGFGLGKMEAELKTGTVVDLAVEPTINDFNGRRNVELEIKDLRYNRN